LVRSGPLSPARRAPDDRHGAHHADRPRGPPPGTAPALHDSPTTLDDRRTTEPDEAAATNAANSKLAHTPSATVGTMARRAGMIERPNSPKESTVLRHATTMPSRAAGAASPRPVSARKMP